MKRMGLRVILLISFGLLSEPAFAGPRDYSYATLRCQVPPTFGLSRAIRRTIEQRLAADQNNLRARVNVRFRRLSRMSAVPVHMDELLSGIEISELGEFHYQISGSPVLHHCVADYEVQIQLAISRYNNFSEPFYEDYDYGDNYYCRYYGDCQDRIETITRSSTSHVQLEGILVG